MFFGWYVVAGTFVAQMVIVGFFTYSVSLLVPMVREEFAVSMEQVMYSLTAGTFMGMVLMPLAGVMLDRYPVRWIMAAGFSPLWGAFTFPMTASAVLFLSLSAQTDSLAAKIIGVAVLVAATFFVPWVASKVIRMWLKGTLATKTNASKA